MKGKIAFSPTGRSKWLIFFFVIIVQFAVLGYLGWRWHNISVDGIPYQWRCVPRIEVLSFGTDYVRIIFPEDTTEWLDDTTPEIGQDIYVRISRDEKGLMKLDGASAFKPVLGESDYMRVRVIDFKDGSVQFQTSFDRYRIAPEEADGIYDINSSDNVVASIRIKKGEGVIEGVFVNGMPLEACSTAAALEASRQNNDSGDSSEGQLKRPHIVESGMVPPKEE